MKEVYLDSKRNSKIHAYINTTSNKGGLLVFAHSFKGEASEDNRFTDLANSLVNNGINSIRMEFPGSINSFEDDKNYSIGNCLDDLDICVNYMFDNYDIDHNHLGLLGYSMGGRIVSLYALSHPEFNMTVLWAPCDKVFTKDELFLEQSINDLINQEGDYINFYDIFNKVNCIFPKQFAYDLIDTSISKFNEYKGNVLIIHGKKDTTIDITESEKLLNSFIYKDNKSLYVMDEADHGFGLWDGRIEDTNELLRVSENYIKKNL